MQIGLGIGVGARPSPFSLVQQAISTLRRLNATLIGLPDDYGLVLGPELVSNGDFSNGLTGWNNASTGTGAATVVSGQLSLYTLDSSNSGRVNQPVATPGKTHRIRFTVVSGSAYVSLAGVGGNYPPGTYSLAWVPVGASLYIENPGFGTTCVVDNISVREIISAQHFIDSTGTQPVTAIGDLVGLTLDRMGSVGAQLFTQNPINTASGWSASGGSSGSGSTISLPNTNSEHIYDGVAASGSGKTFELIVVATGSGTVNFSITNNVNQRLSVQASLTGTPSTWRTVLAMNGTVSPAYRFSVARDSLTATSVTLVSVDMREITGNHATQATTASKPTVTRVPKRLGPNLVVNGGFDSDTAWTKGSNVTISGGVATTTGTANFATLVAQPSCSVVSGKTYQIQANVNRTSGSNIAFQFGPQNALIASGTQFWSSTFTANNSGGLGVIEGNGTTWVGSIDNIAVQEVLEWSNALKFDGSNDLLTLGSGAILQQGSDHFVTAAFVLDAVGVTSTIYAASNTSNGTPFGAWFYVDGTTNKLSCSWRDDAGVNVLLISSAVLPAGAPYVATAAKVGNAYTLWLNGVVTATQTATLGATTLNTATLGALVRTSTANYLNGKIVDVTLGQSTLSDSDRRTIERYMGAQIGVTIA